MEVEFSSYGPVLSDVISIVNAIIEITKDKRLFETKDCSKRALTIMENMSSDDDFISVPPKKMKYTKESKEQTGKCVLFFIHCGLLGSMSHFSILLKRNISVSGLTHFKESLICVTSF